MSTKRLNASIPGDLRNYDEETNLQRWPRTHVTELQIEKTLDDHHNLVCRATGIVKWWKWGQGKVLQIWQEFKCSTRGGGVNVGIRNMQAHSLTLISNITSIRADCVFEWEIVKRIKTMQWIHNREELNQSQNSDLTNRTSGKIPNQYPIG